jgi:hypothetical protein
LVAARTRAFRKQNHERTGLQRSFDFIGRAPRVGAFVSINKDRSRQTREKAQYRPSPDVTFGNEYRGRNGAECNDVEIAQVIGHEQTMFGDKSANVYLKVEDVE